MVISSYKMDGRIGFEVLLSLAQIESCQLERKSSQF